MKLIGHIPPHVFPSPFLTYGFPVKGDVTVAVSSWFLLISGQTSVTPKPGRGESYTGEGGLANAHLMHTHVGLRPKVGDTQGSC